MKYRQAKKYHLSASALFYALIVAVLIAAFSTAIITVAYYHQLMNDFELLEKKLIRNTYAALELLKAEQGSLDKVALDLHDETIDSVLVKKMPWGLFEIGAAEAFQQTVKGRLNYQKIALLGQVPKADWEQSALYLKDGFKPLTLAGQTNIEGNVFLPKAGVKGGYVDGRSFSGKELINGAKNISQKELPPLNRQLIERQITLFQQAPNRDFYALPDSVQQSFFESTLVFRDSVLYINEQLLKGNICLVADSLVYISRNSVVEDVLIYAPDIYIEEGFKGSFQAFSTRSLEVGRYCELVYPTVLAAFSTQKSKKNNSLIIRNNALMKGLILTYDLKKGKPYPISRIEKEAIIEGQIYSNAARLDLKGTVLGNVTTAGFRLQATSSVYENHLLDVEINYAKRGAAYLNPILINHKTPIQFAKWLY